MKNEDQTNYSSQMLFTVRLIMRFQPSKNLFHDDLSQKENQLLKTTIVSHSSGSKLDPLTVVSYIS